MVWFRRSLVSDCDAIDYFNFLDSRLCGNDKIIMSGIDPPCLAGLGTPPMEGTKIINNLEFSNNDPIFQFLKI
jgi:hypothetical protein